MSIQTDVFALPYENFKISYKLDDPFWWGFYGIASRQIQRKYMQPHEVSVVSSAIAEGTPVIGANGVVWGVLPKCEQIEEGLWKVTAKTTSGTLTSFYMKPVIRN